MPVFLLAATPAFPIPTNRTATHHFRFLFDSHFRLYLVPTPQQRVNPAVVVVSENSLFPLLGCPRPLGRNWW